MLFQSVEFALFLPICFFLYWFVFNKKIVHQNLLIVTASYFFYGFWDWNFLLLIFFSTVVDYSIGLKLKSEKRQTHRRFLLWVSILVNIGVLFIFKYFNFFLDNFIKTFLFFGAKVEPSTLNIILPVGISFYTFQTLSYTIDIYHRKLKPTNDFVAFAAFVSFFPQLVAGPIERASNLLPQFYLKRVFDLRKASDGLRQILWGLFKKVVIADSCATYANIIFNNSDDYSGSTLILGSVFFAFQIYGDFSGYSDIAIGVSRLFGFNLMKNFSFPYFSRDIAEFWRRWHISLNTWFRDYVYFPLGGSRGNRLNQIRNVFIIFIISGLWHGANWTYVFWGLINAVFFIPLLLIKRNRKNIEIVAKDRFLPSYKEVMEILTTFFITCFAWVFFRAENISHAFNYIDTIFSNSLFDYPWFEKDESVKSVLLLLIIFILIEWIGREYEFAIANLKNINNRGIRWLFYLLISLTIFFYNGKEQEFIYFQF